MKLMKKVASVALATAMTVSSSNPLLAAPARASPLNLSKILFINLSFL